MLKVEMKFATYLFLASVLLPACRNGTEKHTEAGTKYIMYTENSGPKAKKGDFVTIELLYKTEGDSVLFNSGHNKMPMRFQLQDSPFNGSMEQGLTFMAEGDSATFFVSADSMVQKVFSRMAGGNYSRPSFLKTGSFLKFDVKLLRIQNEMDASLEMFRELDKRSEQEKADVAKYLQDHQVTTPPDSTGIYMIKSQEGKGPAVESGKTVTMNYKGKFLSGEIFDSNDKLKKPYSFIAGAGDVIPGLEIAIRKFRAGDKVTLIVPSTLAFGEEGLRNKMNGTYVVEPNTPLLFEVEVIEVK